MGKTTFLLNLYVRYSRKTHSPFKIALVPLGHTKADDLIRALPDKSQTVILLDAFDEDTLAIVDHRLRLAELITLCGEFRHIVLACRTQFFFSDEEIPRETGVLRFGPTGPGESRNYLFNKVYLSPFSDSQIAEYLTKRFPIWKYRYRYEAFQICNQIGDLAVRPMLLAHIQEIQKKGVQIKKTSNVYEQLIQAWIERERAFVDGETLLGFSEDLAVEIYSNRKARGSEVISINELRPLADRFGINLDEWQLTGRSLLNRTADGSRKFAHRSIMEYLVIRRFVAEPDKVGAMQWTDQMKKFFWEMLTDRLDSKALLSSNLVLADLVGFHRSPNWQVLDNPQMCPPIIEALFEGIGGPRRPRGLYVLDYVSGIICFWPTIQHSADWQSFPVQREQISLNSLWSREGVRVTVFGTSITKWTVQPTAEMDRARVVLTSLPAKVRAAIDLEFTIWSQWQAQEQATRSFS
ncbi:MAG: NACHT domain-containing protein [Bryobacteraceae bacterium]